mmetsp:Transcript_2121/g.3892  ORF Transcript_2121/g.3892 Transcript_2121/m.3892 type:complete len:93 (-) Transcript_2121:361-639(-)
MSSFGKPLQTSNSCSRVFSAFTLCMGVKVCVAMATDVVVVVVAVLVVVVLVALLVVVVIVVRVMLKLVEFQIIAASVVLFGRLCFSSWPFKT